MRESLAVLSVVVGTWNRRRLLQRCLDSVFAETSVPVVVYVTDAGSTDGTIEYLQSIASDRLIPIFLGKKVGQARAYNEVFDRVATPYVCWLSDDNAVVHRGLDVAANILQKHPEIGMVGLKVKDTVGPFVDAPYIGGVSTIGILNVNQGMLRTSVLKQLGGFSEAFRDYGIDPDLTARVLLAGHAVVYTRVVAVHHDRNWGADTTTPEYAQQMEKQEAYRKRYARKYEAFAQGPWSWHLKRTLWQRAGALFGLSARINSSKPLWGLLVRDWHNIFSARLIRVWDAWRCRGQDYYLYQVWPRNDRPSQLPSDPLEGGFPSSSS